jgi:hypothetical protein
MVCSVKVGSVVELEECIYLSLVCDSKKIAEFCLSEEEYATLGEPKAGDVVDYSIVTTTYNDGTSMRKIEVRFLGRPVRL